MSSPSHSLTFYHSPHSTSSVTAAILAELNQPHPSLPTITVKQITLSLETHDTHAPDYLANVNPNGRVPAIVHDGTTIWESAAITMYLGETFGVDRGLYPPLGPQRGEAMKWVVWTNVTLTTPTRALMAALRKGEKEGEGKAREEIMGALGVLESGLKGREWLLGEGGYSLADTHVWCFVHWMGMMGVGLEEVKGVKGWAERVGKREALKGL